MKPRYKKHDFGDWLIAILLAALISFCLFSCLWPGIDIIDPPPPPPQDTIPPDPLPIEVDTCVDLIEYLEPEFSTLYFKYDFPTDTVLFQGGGISSYNLADVIDKITNLPFEVGYNNVGAWAIIKGTNNHQLFQLKVFAWIGGAKWYMGTGKQALILPGIEPDGYKSKIDSFPSFNQFSFWGTDYDSIQYVELCREVLSDCREGRAYADLFFIPFELPQSIPDSLDLVGWDRVRE